MDFERRFVPIAQAGIELRANGEDGARGIVGRAAVFNSWSVVMWDFVGEFREMIMPGAFTNALERSDIRGLYNHDPNYLLGRDGRSMRVWETADGLWYDIPEMPQARRDVVEAIERGDLDGNSFSFTVTEDGEEWREGEDGIFERYIHEVEEAFDVGPVAFPAYPATDVAARHVVVSERASRSLKRFRSPWRREIARRKLALLG